jgi:hypothetical protein
VRAPRFIEDGTAYVLMSPREGENAAIFDTILEWLRIATAGPGGEQADRR